MEEYGIEHHKSSPYRPQANGIVEVANKNVKDILAKMVVTYKDWVEKLPFAQWGYRISIWASIEATPYDLVYGSEAVHPIEIEKQSLRVLVETVVGLHLTIRHGNTPALVRPVGGPAWWFGVCVVRAELRVLSLSLNGGGYLSTFRGVAGILAKF